MLNHWATPARFLVPMTPSLCDKQKKLLSHFQSPLVELPTWQTYCFSPQPIPWNLVLGLSCPPLCGHIMGSGALNGDLYVYFAVISYGNPTSFLELCKGEAVSLFTGGSTDLQFFLMLEIVFLSLLLLLPQLSLPLFSTLISNALAPFCLHSKSLLENYSK